MKDHAAQVPTRSVHSAHIFMTMRCCWASAAGSTSNGGLRKASQLTIIDDIAMHGMRYALPRRGVSGPGYHLKWCRAIQLHVPDPITFGLESTGAWARVVNRKENCPELNTCASINRGRNERDRSVRMRLINAYFLLHTAGLPHMWSFPRFLGAGNSGLRNLDPALLETACHNSG